MQKKVSTEGLELMCHLDTETRAISRHYKKVRFEAIYNVLALKNRTPRRSSSLMWFHFVAVQHHDNKKKKGEVKPFHN